MRSHLPLETFLAHVDKKLNDDFMDKRRLSRRIDTKKTRALFIVSFATAAIYIGIIVGTFANKSGTPYPNQLIYKTISAIGVPGSAWRSA